MATPTVALTRHTPTFRYLLANSDNTASPGDVPVLNTVVYSEVEPLNMIAMNGYRGARIQPIILTTGFSESISAETCKELGIRAYLRRPVVARELGKAIRQVINDQHKEV